MADREITFETDQHLLSQLGGKGYMAPCSPWFFTVSRLQARDVRSVYYTKPNLVALWGGNLQQELCV